MVDPGETNAWTQTDHQDLRRLETRLHNEDYYA